MTHRRTKHAVLTLAILGTCCLLSTGCRSGIAPTAPEPALTADDPFLDETAGTRRPPTSHVAGVTLLASAKVESPDGRIEGEVELFLRDGDVVVSGWARGMDPHTIDNCVLLPVGSDCGDATLPGVKLGKWSVGKNGVGELKRTLTDFDPATIADFGSMSVRRTDSRTPDVAEACGALVLP